MKMPASGGAGEQKEKKKKRERNKRALLPTLLSPRNRSPYAGRASKGSREKGGDLEIHICWTNHPLPPYHRWKLGRWKKTIFIYLYIFFFIRPS